MRLDPALDDIVAADTHLEKLADDFGVLEGPVWVRKGGYLLFSDIPANVINKWTPHGKVSVFLKPSGYTGKNPSEHGREVDNGRAVVNLIGSVGVTLDRQGRVVFCAQGDRAGVGDVQVESPSPSHRLVIALHSPSGFTETGLQVGSSEKRATKLACGVE